MRKTYFRSVIKIFFETLLVFSVFATRPWRTSLRNCWTDGTCRRALIISHGGAWTPTEPYASFPAFKRAFEEGTDCVKGDIRISKDSIGVVVHSSPLKWYESENCDGKYVQNMTAEKITEHCQMYFTLYHFMSLKRLLDWAKEKVIVMLCVKDYSVLQEIINEIVDLNAFDRVFLEVSVENMVKMIPKLENWKKIYYLAQGHSKEDVDILLKCNNTDILNRSFTFEFSDEWKELNESLSQAIKRLHAVGIRTLMKTSTFLPSVEQQKEIFEMDIDVVYSYDTKNGVKARTIVDIERGIDPP